MSSYTPLRANLVKKEAQTMRLNNNKSPLRIEKVDKENLKLFEIKLQQVN
jgi:hypothetical protein